jgi:hypothetical protein
MVDTLPAQPRKGRGAISNPKSRFDREERVAIDDGWARATPEAHADGAKPDIDVPAKAADSDDELPPLVAGDAARARPKPLGHRTLPVIATRCDKPPASFSPPSCSLPPSLGGSIEAGS